MSENAYKLKLPEHLLRAKVHDVFNISHLRKYHSTTPKIDALTHSNFENVVPENPVLLRDEPDEPELREPSQEFVQNILQNPEHHPASPEPPLPVSQRPDVRRKLFKHYLSHREMIDMQGHDVDAPLREKPSSSPTSLLDAKADVMMDPVVFREACKILKFKPTVDLFANANHHQLPRYYSPKYDPRAAGVNAFSINWSREWHPYANPTWHLIGQVLRKIADEKVTVMCVVPDWTRAPWYELWQKLCVRSVIYTIPIFLDAQNEIRPKPK